MSGHDNFIPFFKFESLLKKYVAHISIGVILFGKKLSYSRFLYYSFRQLQSNSKMFRTKLLAVTSVYAIVAILVFFITAAIAADGKPFAGINLATGSFAAEHLPGRYSFDYIYPDSATAEPFLSAGMTVVRLPVLWERLQPVPGGELDATEMERVDALLDRMAPFRMAILDVHNYGRYRGKRIDTDPALRAAFGDLWSRLAKRYAGRTKVAFGIMNEPYDMSARAARDLADVAIAAIRKTGARNLVLVPGTQWTGAHSWTSGGDASNASAFADFHDPADRFVFEMHDYLDRDSSGTQPACVSEDIGEQRLKDATVWLRQQKRQAILGEFGASSDPLCLRALDRMLGFMEANADVWMGWTYWAGGEWWGDYFMSVQPQDGKSRPQMDVLRRHVPKSP